MLSMMDNDDSFTQRLAQYLPSAGAGVKAVHARHFLHALPRRSR